MNFRILLVTAAVTLAPAFGISGAAHAIVADPGLKAPGLTEDVACRMVRSRIVGPRGGVSYRTVRRCSPGRAMRGHGCTTVRQRIVGPRGGVTFKTVRRCR